MLGDTLFWLGELTSARAHLEQGLALYNPEHHRADVFFHGYDPGVFSLFYEALVLWLNGYPNQASKRSEEALALAQELAHPFSLASALAFAAQLHHYRREMQLARERAEACVTLSTERGFAFWLVWGTLLRGRALIAEGREEEGISLLREGIAAYQAMGAGVGLSTFLTLLIEAHGQVGQVEEGLAMVAKALAMVEQTGERVGEAELYRLKAELILRPGPRGPSSAVPTEAEECLRRAITIARHQNAKSWELRAVMSLSRLWQRQGKKVEARQLLADIYGWFTEGFDTADLKDAKVLLDRLSA
jgi:predicted ATPase